jgi:hypothetical protein
MLNLIIRGAVLILGGYALGDIMSGDNNPPVIIQQPPSPPSGLPEGTLTPAMVIACAVLLAAFGYVIWMLRRKD